MILAPGYHASNKWAFNCHKQPGGKERQPKPGDRTVEAKSLRQMSGRSILKATYCHLIPNKKSMTKIGQMRRPDFMGKNHGPRQYDLKSHVLPPETFNRL
jgi:hypothetical protein